MTTCAEVQLLAAIDYLPPEATPSGPAPRLGDMAMDQADPPGVGPTSRPSRWPSGAQGSFDEVMRAAVKAFENDNGSVLDGIAGPAVRTADLLNAVAAQKTDSTLHSVSWVNSSQRT